MKIYTEINYKWLDNQLVETSSESFEYKGELTLCGPGGGGGGTLEQITTDPAGAITEGITSGTAAVTEEAGRTGETVTNVTSEVTDPIQENVTAGANIVSENLAAGSDMATTEFQSGLESAATTTTTNLQPVMAEGARFGETLDTNMAPIKAELDRWGDATLTNINSVMNWVAEKGQELTNFIHNPQQTPTVALDKKGAFKGSTVKKSKADLGVNKAKKRARKSLRIY